MKGASPNPTRVLGTVKRMMLRRLESTLPLVTQTSWLPLKWGAVLHRTLAIPAAAHVRGKRIRLHVSSHVELDRVRRYATKEPETLEWIDGFEPDTVFFDVGANIGVYSLYAAARHGPGIRVVAFEPESLNYAALNLNVALNGFQHAIRGYCLALSDSPSLSVLSIDKLRAGGSNNQFGDRHSAPSHLQGSIGLSLDQLCSHWDLPRPHALKIDVDGLELPILRGAEGILSHPNFRTLLVELLNDDPAQMDEVRALCDRAQLELVSRSQRRNRDLNYVFRKRKPLATPA